MPNPNFLFRGSKSLITNLGADAALSRALGGAGIGAVLGGGNKLVSSITSGNNVSDIGKDTLAGAIGGGVIGGGLGAFQGRGLKYLGRRGARVLNRLFK